MGHGGVWVLVILVRGLARLSGAKLQEQLLLLFRWQIPDSLDQERFQALCRRSQGVLERQFGHPCMPAFGVQALAVQFHVAPGNFLP